jgi:hypothetical protein
VPVDYRWRERWGCAANTIKHWSVQRFRYLLSVRKKNTSSRRWESSQYGLLKIEQMIN